MREKPSEELLEFYNIGAAQKVERYEITAYESLIDMAEKLGMSDAVELLEQNLQEEEAALNKLKAIASEFDVTEEDRGRGRRRDSFARRRQRRDNSLSKITVDVRPRSSNGCDSLQWSSSRHENCKHGQEENRPDKTRVRRGQRNAAAPHAARRAAAQRAPKRLSDRTADIARWRPIGHRRSRHAAVCIARNHRPTYDEIAQAAYHRYLSRGGTRRPRLRRLDRGRARARNRRR